MQVALIELPARFDAQAEVEAEIERLVLDERLPIPDVTLLSEAALTGYVSADGDFDLRRFGEPLGGPTTQRMSNLAKRAHTTLAFPLVEKDGPRYFNTFVVVSPRGDIIAHYRKRHPWYPETWATPGNTHLPRFEVAGVRLSLAICFDVHFLESEERDTLSAVDALLFPSAWVEEDTEDHRASILGRIARRFDIGIANANWGLGAPRTLGQGGSRIITSEGEIARSAGHAPQRIDGVVHPRAGLDRRSSG